MSYRPTGTYGGVLGGLAGTRCRTLSAVVGPLGRRLLLRLTLTVTAVHRGRLAFGTSCVATSLTILTVLLLLALTDEQLLPMDGALILAQREDVDVAPLLSLARELETTGVDQLGLDRVGDDTEANRRVVDDVAVDDPRGVHVDSQLVQEVEADLTVVVLEDLVGDVRGDPSGFEQVLDTPLAPGGLRAVFGVRVGRTGARLGTTHPLEVPSGRGRDVFSHESPYVGSMHPVTGLSGYIPPIKPYFYIINIIFGQIKKPFWAYGVVSSVEAPGWMPGNLDRVLAQRWEREPASPSTWGVSMMTGIGSV